MAFWIAILAGMLFAWLAIRMGLYETWALLFNVIISIYVSIFLAPLLAKLAPASSYGVAFSMIVLAGGCFAILHGLSYVFLTGQFSVQFPRFFDILLGGALGFAGGFLILSFVALVVTTMPLAQHKLVSNLGLDPQSQGANLSGLAWCCDRVHAIAGFSPHDDATREAVQRLLETAQRMASGTDAGESDYGEPAVTPTTPRPGRTRDPVDDLERL
jgi:hypothetical protein